MNKFSFNDLVKLLNLETETSCNSCKKNNFRAWGNVTPEIKINLEELGELAFSKTSIIQNGYAEYHPNGTNYWSENAPIALDFFPYHESKIVSCKVCHAVFFNYTEYSGHAPQDRIRLIRKDLIFYPDTDKVK